MLIFFSKILIYNPTNKEPFEFWTLKTFEILDFFFCLFNKIVFSRYKQL